MEVQIRTTKMHFIAEYGLAAHWRYKEADRAAVAQSSEFAERTTGGLPCMLCCMAGHCCLQLLSQCMLTRWVASVSWLVVWALTGSA